MTENFLFFGGKHWIEYQARSTLMMGVGTTFRDIVSLGGIPLLPYPSLN